MVICIKLCSCSLLLSQGGIFGLLFLKIQSGFWFEYLYLFASSEKQSCPDLAITPLHMVCFQWAIWIHNTEWLLGRLPDNSLQQQVCLSALQGATPNSAESCLQSRREFASSHLWHGSVLCWKWWQSSTNYQIAVWWNCSPVSMKLSSKEAFLIHIRNRNAPLMRSVHGTVSLLQRGGTKQLHLSSFVATCYSLV